MLIQEGIAPVDTEFDFDAYSIDNIPVWFRWKADKPMGLTIGICIVVYTTICLKQYNLVGEKFVWYIICMKF